MFFGLADIGLPSISILSSGVALSPSFALIPFKVILPFSIRVSAFLLEV